MSSSAANSTIISTDAAAPPSSSSSSSSLTIAATPSSIGATITHNTNDDDEDDDDDDDDDDSSSSSAPLPAAAVHPHVPSPTPEFDRDRHILFFAAHLRSIPGAYDTLDNSRMTLLYFCLSSLDVLGAIDSAVMSKNLAPSLIDWIYAQQVHPYVDAAGVERVDNCGFRGGPWAGVKFEPHRTLGLAAACFPHDESHLAQTYTALCCLRILGDTSFSRVNRRAIIRALPHIQTSNGSFSGTCSHAESDLRFLYCAVVISDMLDDWSGLDVQSARDYIKQSQNYDGAFGLWPGGEGHGGSTYCAVASLALMARAPPSSSSSLSSSLSSSPSSSSSPSTSSVSSTGSIADVLSPKSMRSLVKWCIMRQGDGYRGRPGKACDSCYSFWLGATLSILADDSSVCASAEGEDIRSMTRPDANRRFNLACQQRCGGFSKGAGKQHPDLLHSYLGMCGLSIMGRDQALLKIDCKRGMTIRCAGAEKE